MDINNQTCPLTSLIRELRRAICCASIVAKASTLPSSRILHLAHLATRLREVRGQVGLNKYLLLLPLLCACHKEGPWVCNQIPSKAPSSKWTCVSADPTYTLSFELLRTSEGTKGYLIAHSTPIPPTSSPLPIRYTIDEKESKTEGYLLQGGQKILLSDILTQTFIGALQQGKTIHIALRGYKSILCGKEFPASLQ